jgi:hypothetical protein
MAETEDRLAAIEARLKATGPARWFYENQLIKRDDQRVTWVCEVVGSAANPEHQADANLIAHAPDDLAWCIKEIRRLRVFEARVRAGWRLTGFHEGSADGPELWTVAQIDIPSGDGQ